MPSAPHRLVFQSTRPRGRTRPSCILSSEAYLVSIHASSREDATHKPVTVYAVEVFQSTRPRGRTRPAGLNPILSATGGFNPRVLAGGRDSHNKNISEQHNSFNPRVLAGGRDCANQAYLGQLAVSIHASSREDATYGIILISLPRLFQSTRPRGRTRPT